MFTASPFDLYDLHLFGLVVTHRSFTRAARAAGLTQSAVTRQIQDLERSVGLPLLQRTTREVVVTEAGSFLFGEARRLIGDCEATCSRLREEFAGTGRRVRIGVSRSLSLAHLPGLLHANLRRQPDVTCSVTHGHGDDLLAALTANALDLAIVTRRARLPPRLLVTHRFKDQFCLVTPEAVKSGPTQLSARRFREWGPQQTWMTLQKGSETGRRLHEWMRRQGVNSEPAFEVDSFDLILNLVALGMGCAFVPSRTLSLYQGRRPFRRVKLPFRFERELIVVSRHQRQPAAHVTRFVRNILFQH